jgi:hypothetical protein
MKAAAAGVLRMTAREVLVDVAGSEHQDHTVVSRAHPVDGAVKFKCSCGIICEVQVTTYFASLENVPDNLK